jgi:hypothetical protein
VIERIESGYHPAAPGRYHGRSDLAAEPLAYYPAFDYDLTGKKR